jgi:hypothetical protein
VESLGFEIAFRFSGNPDNYAGCAATVFLDMQWQHEDNFRSLVRRKSQGTDQIDDPDELFAEYEHNRVFGDATKLRDTAWGTREFGFSDPDGNGLIFYREL